MNKLLNSIRIKKFGAVYTPPHIVKMMLDLAGYRDSSILEKHILENSFGNGAFLKEIVERYCNNFCKKYGNNPVVLKEHLERYIHGIEIDCDEYTECIINLNIVVSKYNIYDVEWDFYNEDAISFNKFDGLMDYVIGNPPYVRTHNLDYHDIKNLEFTKRGMTDLYLAFYEIGFKQLNSSGKLCYITPSSFFTSKSGIYLRNYINNTHSLSCIVDLGRVQVFENIMSYTAITLFQKNKVYDCIRYIDYETGKEELLPYSVVFQNGSMYFESTDLINFISEVYSTASVLNNSIIVKNGYATLADKIFINNNIDEDIVLPVLKASTGIWNKCIFPYDINGIPYEEEYISNKYPLTYKYLSENKEKLMNRSLEKNGRWYLFGRSQGVKDTYKNKIAVNTIIKDLGSVKLNNVGKGKGVHSGLYILTSYKYDDIYDVIYHEDFIKYLKLIKKYKNSGYYTFSSKELEKYLFYKLQT